MVAGFTSGCAVRLAARGWLVAVVVLAIAQTAIAQGAIALVNVNVVPMDRERVLAHQTVLVDSGRIVAMGATDKVYVSRRFRVIEGRGVFVMPGLSDMHVHFMRDSAELLLYIANGVTAVRDLSGE